MIGYKHAIKLAIEITVQLQGIECRFFAGRVGAGRYQCMAELIAQAHHQWMCGYPYRQCLMPAAYPFGCGGPGRHDPACWFALPDDGGSLTSIADVDQCVQLLQARGQQDQPLACLSALEGVDPVYGFGTERIAAKTVDRFRRISDNTTTLDAVDR